MRITVVRTGGFGGLRLEKSLDTTDQPELDSLVDHADLVAGTAPEPAYADRFVYEISTDDGRTGVVGETHMSDSQRTLVDRVMATS
ncbi:protealysin inhibitor emfourin [Fodinicola feengrottensis]|uniref:Uncharacterized protein n=1 Tax=Fodinicola feengrottensis TaxID=435914 RepID=A0ABP4VDG5_9ACTN|nr:protealysin inhibitor emfourin [Fodinicola feengrottensis]